MKTKVIFRKWNKRNGGGIIAIFPENPTTLYNDNCDMFEVHGGHGGGDYYAVVKNSKLATEDEYAGVKGLLEVMYEYDLEVRKRYTYDMRMELRAEQQRYKDFAETYHKEQK